MYWREPLEGQSCTVDATAHYYHFPGRYSRMLRKIFILLMGLSMVYTSFLVVYNIYVSVRPFKPQRKRLITLLYCLLNHPDLALGAMWFI